MYRFFLSFPPPLSQINCSLFFHIHAPYIYFSRPSYFYPTVHPLHHSYATRGIFRSRILGLKARLCLNGTDDEAPDHELRLSGDGISKTKDLEKCADSDLWHACAGSMAKALAIGSFAYYFPQGHGEHAHFPFENLHKLNKSHVLCRVVFQKLMADAETDEVYFKTRLISVDQNPEAFNDTPAEVPKKPLSFTKTLTQSDANNGGGFSVPKQCAEAVFPSLNYQDNPPVQTISCIDVHGKTWTFRHIYRGSPKRHLLTTNWSAFVSQKKLRAGDSIVFLKKESGEIHIGIRRMKPSNSDMFSRRTMKDSVTEAVKNALSGREFEVVYYPRAGTPEYVVKAEVVREATMIPWRRGMRFKMAVESEDRSRISWFMGTVTEVIDGQKPLWKQLEVKWEEAGRVLEDVKRVNTWSVEPLWSMYMPPIHLDEKPCLGLPPYDYLPPISPLTTFNGHQLPLSLPQLHYPAISGIQGSRQSNNYTIKFTATTATNKRKSSFSFRDDDLGKDDIACELTIGVGQATATAASTPTLAAAASVVIFGKTVMNNAEEEQLADVSSSGNTNRSSSSPDHEADDNAPHPMIKFI